MACSAFEKKAIQPEARQLLRVRLLVFSDIQTLSSEEQLNLARGVCVCVCERMAMTTQKWKHREGKMRERRTRGEESCHSVLGQNAF